MQKGLAPLLPRCQLEPRMQEVLSKCRHGGAGPLGHLGDTAGGGTGGKGATMWPPRGPRPHVCFSLGHRLPRFLMFLSVVRAAWWGGGRASQPFHRGFWNSKRFHVPAGGRQGKGPGLRRSC